MHYDEEAYYSDLEEINISACPMLIEGEEQESSLWGYYLCVENNSNKKIQLVGKNWNISDSCGQTFSDDSEGFNGELPELEPGECFEFTDTISLSRDAVFYGSCRVNIDNKIKEVKIPTFCLDSKKSDIVLN